MVGANLNWHVGEGNNGDKKCMGRHGLGKRNNVGQAVVDFAKRMKLAITNTYFVKEQAHRVTYNSGGRSSQVDYVMVRRRMIKKMVDTKVIVGESVAKQHRIVVSAIIIWTKWRKAPKPVKRIKWWKLKDSKVKNKFKMKVIESGIFCEQEDWQKVAEMIRSIARMELGEISGKVSTEGKRETWWWNQEVQEKLKDKRKAKKVWDTTRDDPSNFAHKTARKQAKREVAKARKRHTRNCTLHQSTATSTWWCGPPFSLGWVEMAVGLPEGPSYPGHSPCTTIFSPCCPLNDRRRAAHNFFKIGRLFYPFSCLSLAHLRLLILLLLLMSGKVHPNPGPIFPYSVCAGNVTWRGRSVQCCTCSRWVNLRCSLLSLSKFRTLN